MKVVEMRVERRATNGLVFWVLHGQKCQRRGRLDAPLPTPEITLSAQNKNNTLASKHARSSG